jgi:Flp pilus assembly protein TadD
LYQSGTSALDRGDSTQAVAELEHAAELLPEASEVQNHLGLAYQAAGRERDAEFAFRRAVALDCGNAAAVENLRVAEARAGVERP